MNKLIVITGQTATGKTKLALNYAQKYNGELINCDSRQIYKYLDIITGKEKELFTGVKVWLYDVVKPNEHFSSFDFVKLAVPIIKKILSEGKTPILVGGTYFYLYHLLYNIDTENIPPNWKLRKTLENKTTVELQNSLKFLNPKILFKLNNSEKNNPQRLIRKIEIAQNQRRDVPAGRLYNSKNLEILHKTSLQKKLNIKNIKIIYLGLKFKDKEFLRKTIKKRVEERLKQGAVEEVKKLLKMGYNKNHPGLKTIGYQQLILHLKGAIDFDTAIQQWITKEIEYAKRQYAFMKKDKNISWKEI